MNKKISTPIAFSIIIILSVVVGIVDYWLYSEIQNLKLTVSELKIPEKKEIQEESNGWNVYANKEYGFTIDYPKEWQVAEMLSPSTQSYIKSLFAVVFEKKIGDLICSFEIEVVDSKNSLFQDEINALVASNFEKSDIILAGFPTTKLSFRDAKSCTSYIIKKSEDDYFRIDQYIMEEFFKDNNISIYLEDIPECTEVFNQTLSTFKFLD